MIDSYLANKQHIFEGKQSKNFQIFGFDFLLDEDLRVWLIEVKIISNNISKKKYLMIFILDWK
jgi:hypothetical protein